MCINIILLLGLLNYICFYIFGKNNILGCGIVAWAGKTPNKFNKAKFDLVGSYNEERGIHSCGVASDGKITIGVSNNKVFRDFIVNVGYENPQTIPGVIGHTRHATFGTHNAENAHPFGFGNIKVENKKEESFKFIGVHNGSLLNHKEIGNIYDVSTRETTVNEYNVNIDREKIDSEVLLETLYKTNNFKVLSKYLGAAALVWQDLSNPNVMYCWHGASKKYDFDKDDKIFEERPLYYYKETRNSLYISSLENSLKAIGGTDDTIGEFEHNVVYKITDGNIERAIKTKISRKKCHYLKTTGYHYNRPVNNNDYKEPNSKVGKNFTLDGLMSDDIDDEQLYLFQGCCHTPDIAKNKVEGFTSRDRVPFLPVNNDSIRFNIYYERHEDNISYNKTYFNKLRYWKNTNLLKGCYIFIKGFGFYFLSTTLKGAEDKFWTITNKEFFGGEFVFSNQIFSSKREPYVPFIHIKGKNEISRIPIYFFYEGIRVLDLMDYNRCLEVEAEGKPFNWEALTHCAAHPIMDIGQKTKTSFSQNIQLNGKLFNDVICPLGSDRIYTIKDGNCVLIENKKVDDKEEIKKYSSLEEIMTELETNEFEILEKEKDSIKENNVTSLTVIKNDNNDLLEKAIDEIFKLLFQKLPMDVKRLQMYTSHARAKEGILLIEDFLKEAREYVEFELKE